MTRVLQTTTDPTLYVSELINDRFQILESDVFRGNFYIFDHQKDDIYRDKDGSTFYFDNAEIARMSISNVNVKPVKAPKATKPAKAPKAVKVAKQANEPKAAKVSFVSRIFELIRTTEMSDEAIYETVQAEFPDSKSYNVGSVRRRRKVA